MAGAGAGGRSQEAGVRRSVVIPMCPSYNCYAFTDQ